MNRLSNARAIPVYATPSSNGKIQFLPRKDIFLETTLSKLQNRTTDVDPNPTDGQTTSNAAIICGKSKLVVVDIDYCRTYEKATKSTVSDDVLQQRIDDNAFTKTFGTPEEFEKSVDTLTVQTKSGGFHYYFLQTDSEISRPYHFDGVDILAGTNARVFAPGTSVAGFPHDYHIIRDTEIIKPLPQNVKDWVLNQHNKRKKKQTPTVNMNPTPTTTVVAPPTMKCYLGEAEFKTIVDELASEWIDDIKQWKLFTQFCKNIAVSSDIGEQVVKAIWDEKSKTGSGYNKKRNDSFWQFYTVQYCLKATQQILGIRYPYIFAKATIADTSSPDKIYSPDRKYVSQGTDDVLKATFQLHKKRLCLIKADMVMGKTEALLTYIRANQSPFIVLTSRVSLARDIYKRIVANNISCQWYENSGCISDGQSLVCEIESFSKLCRIKKWSTYTVLIDEIDSFVEHIHCSPTCSSTRIQLLSLWAKRNKKSENRALDFFLIVRPTK